MEQPPGIGPIAWGIEITNDGKDFRLQIQPMKSLSKPELVAVAKWIIAQVEDQMKEEIAEYERIRASGKIVDLRKRDGTLPKP